MKISNMEGLIHKVLLDSNKGILVNIPPMLLQCSTKIGCLTISFKDVIVVNVHLGLLVLTIE